MASLTQFVLCDSISQTTEQSTGRSFPLLIAPKLVLRPQFIPGGFSFGVGLGISGVNTEKDNEVRVKIIDPKGNVTYDSGIQKIPSGPKDEIPKQYRGILMTIDIRNLAISQEGTYRFEVYTNGKEIGAQEIPIFKQNKQNDSNNLS